MRTNSRKLTANAAITAKFGMGLPFEVERKQLNPHEKGTANEAEGLRRAVGPAVNLQTEREVLRKKQKKTENENIKKQKRQRKRGRKS